jgi:hypothetical protein
MNPIRRTDKFSVIDIKIVSAIQLHDKIDITRRIFLSKLIPKRVPLRKDDAVGVFGAAL